MLFCFYWNFYFVFTNETELNENICSKRPSQTKMLCSISTTVQNQLKRCVHARIGKIVCFSVVCFETRNDNTHTLAPTRIHTNGFGGCDRKRTICLRATTFSVDDVVVVVVGTMPVSVCLCVCTRRREKESKRDYRNVTVVWMWWCACVYDWRHANGWTLRHRQQQQQQKTR